MGAACCKVVLQQVNSPSVSCEPVLRKGYLVSRLTIVTVLAVLIAMPSSLVAQSPDVESLREAMQAFCDAANSGDIEYISGHYVPEVTRFHDSGELDIGWTERRAKAFAEVVEKGFGFAFERCEVIDARVYGDVGVTAGHMYGYMTYPEGIVAEGPWRFTYLWVWQDEAWKEAHHHVSHLEKN